MSGQPPRSAQTLSASTFVGRYRVARLVYYEAFRYIGNAIAREKEIKGWTRKKKEALVRSMNPQWRDLSVDFGKQFRPAPKTQGPSRQQKGAQEDKNR